MHSKSDRIWIFKWVLTLLICTFVGRLSAASSVDIVLACSLRRVLASSIGKLHRFRENFIHITNRVLLFFFILGQQEAVPPMQLDYLADSPQTNLHVNYVIASNFGSQKSLKNYEFFN